MILISSFCFSFGHFFFFIDSVTFMDGGDIINNDKYTLKFLKHSTKSLLSPPTFKRQVK